MRKQLYQVMEGSVLLICVGLSASGMMLGCMRGIGEGI
jgi:hypothetical protein